MEKKSQAGVLWTRSLKPDRCAAQPWWCRVAPMFLRTPISSLPIKFQRLGLEPVAGYFTEVPGPFSTANMAVAAACTCHFFLPRA